MSIVTFKPRKNAIVALMELAGNELELGFISVGVTPRTLSVFKEDMVSQAEAITTLNEETMKPDLTPLPPSPVAPVPEVTVTPIYPISVKGFWLEQPIRFDVEVNEFHWVGSFSEFNLLKRELGEAKAPGRTYELIHDQVKDLSVKLTQSLGASNSDNFEVVLGGYPLFEFDSVDADPQKVQIWVKNIADGLEIPDIDDSYSDFVTKLYDLTMQGMRELKLARSTRVVEGVRSSTQVPVETAPAPSEVKPEAPAPTVSTSNAFTTALLALPIEVVEALLGFSNTTLNPRLHRRVNGGTSPDAITVSLSPSYLAANYSGKISKPVTTLMGRLHAHFGEIEKVKELRLVLTYLCSLLIENVGKPTSGAAYCDWFKVLEKTLDAADYAIVSNLMLTFYQRAQQGNSLKAQPAKSELKDEEIQPLPDSGEFVKAYLTLPKVIKESLLSNSLRGNPRLHRRFKDPANNDMVSFSIDDPVTRISCVVSNKGSISKVSEALLCSLLNKAKVETTPELRTVITRLVEWLNTYAIAAAKGTYPIDWVEVMRKELSEQDFELMRQYLPKANVASDKPALETTDVTTTEESEGTVVGFTKPDALAQLSQLERASSFATTNWPWFFDGLGNYDLLKLSRQNGKYSIIANTRNKVKGGWTYKTKTLDIEPHYVSIRNTVMSAYLAAVLGTGIERHPEVLALFERYCDAFTTAVLVELHDGSVKRVDSQSVENLTDVESIIDTLTYPSGRLRVARLVKGMSGVFWCVNSDKSELFPNVPKMRIRYTTEDIANSVKKIVEAVVVGTGVKDSPELRNELTSILYLEAGRLKAGTL